MTTKLVWAKARQRSAATRWRAKRLDLMAPDECLPAPARSPIWKTDTRVTQADADVALHHAVSFLDCEGARQALDVRADVSSRVNDMTLKKRLEDRRQRMDSVRGAGRFDSVRRREEKAMNEMVRILERHGAEL